jgi:hypothetical protein
VRVYIPLGKKFDEVAFFLEGVHGGDFIQLWGME